MRQGKIIIRLLSIVLTVSLIFTTMVPCVFSADKESNNKAANGFIEIYNADDLDKVRFNLTGKYILMNDIDLSELPSWIPIGSSRHDDVENDGAFSGVFDGNGHKILNMDITDSGLYGPFSDAGLFGEINKATVKNISLITGSIKTKETPWLHAGAIAGTIQHSRISNCFSNVNIDYKYGKPSGKNGVTAAYGMALIAGGIAGQVYDTYYLEEDIVENDFTIVDHCGSYGKITGSSDSSPMTVGGIIGTGFDFAVNNCFNAGDINVETDYVSVSLGGIVGNSSTTCRYNVRNCYNVGNLTYKTVNKIGDVTYESYVGGITGRDNNSADTWVTNCFYLDSTAKYGTGWVEYVKNDGGDIYAHISIKACSSMQMKKKETFDGFNFDEDWMMGNNQFSYPVPYIMGYEPIGSETKEYSFNYYSQYLEDIAQYSFYFNPDWFVDNKSSYNYNHAIAKASIAMAMAGANTVDTQIRQFYEAIKIKKSDYKYVNPGTDTIGSAIGQIPLKDNSTLIVVTVRGGQYHSEWASNFTVGSGKEHQGFADAAEKVLDRIKKYITDNRIDGEKKVWITGYSRAAATTNIVAERLDELAVSNKINNLEPSNIYAFCFECPRTVIKPDKSAVFNNIINIVNNIDLVTEVAPTYWEYARYGRTMTLPSDEITSHKKYMKKYLKMCSEYQKILNDAGTQKLPKVAALPSQGKVVRNTIDDIAYVIGGTKSGQDGAKFYTGFAQSKMREIGKDFRGEKKQKTLADYVKSTLINLIIDSYGNTKAAKRQLSFIADVLSDTVLAAHYPELCLAWMNSMTGEEFESVPSRVARINCPVNVNVYDDEGKLVAQIVNDEVQEISGNSISAYIDEDEQKVISLPASEEYRVVIKAREDCDVSCQIEEKDLADGTTLRTVNYYDIAMTKNQELEAGIPEVIPDLTEKYSLSGKDGKSINPTNDISGDTSKCVLQVEPMKNGTVQGGGVYTRGEFALLKAEPNSGYRLMGWYEGDKLLSAETEYRFRMETNHLIKAVFQKTEKQELFTDVPEGKWFSDAVYYCRDKGYMAGRGNNRFDPNGTVTRGTITQVLYAMEGKPKVSKSAGFKDVLNGKWYSDSVNWAASIGLVAGYSKVKFGPNDPITRQQMAAILYQYTKYKKYDISAKGNISKFKDSSSVTKYAVTPMKWAVGHGIISGTNKGLEPKGTATRAQIAVILQAFDINIR